MTFIAKAYKALIGIMLEARAANDSDEDGILALLDHVWSMLSQEERDALNHFKPDELGKE